MKQQATSNGGNRHLIAPTFAGPLVTADSGNGGGFRCNVCGQRRPGPNAMAIHLQARYAVGRRDAERIVADALAAGGVTRQMLLFAPDADRPAPSPLGQTQ